MCTSASHVSEAACCIVLLLSANLYTATQGEVHAGYFAATAVQPDTRPAGRVRVQLCVFLLDDASLLRLVECLAFRVAGCVLAGTLCDAKVIQMNGVCSQQPVCSQYIKLACI